MGWCVSRAAAVAWLAVFSGDLPGAVPVTALAFSPDGSVLVSGGRDGLDVRSPRNGAVERRVPCEWPRIFALAFQPGGRHLAVGGGVPGVRGGVVVLDWPAGTVRWRATNFVDLVTSVAFSGDGSRLALAAADHSAVVWRGFGKGETPEVAFALAGHAGAVRSVAFSPTGRTLVTAGADRSIKVWSVDDGRLQRSFSHHTEAVHALAFRPVAGGEAEASPVFCASASEDRTVRVWQPEIGRMVRIVRGHAGPVFAVAYSGNGAVIFSAGQEGIIRAIDAGSDEVVAAWPGHGDWVYSLAVSPDGARLASGDWTGEVRIWEVARQLSRGVTR